MIFGRRYRVTEKLGSGGMAEVFKAVDEVLGRTVAVKVMHSRYAADPTFAARFRKEAQAAANLQSPNIVNMYDWGQESSTFYIVMEYVRGTDLKSLIAESGALPSKRVANIGAQMCSALSVAHRYDIIHRDIKPHNIMVAPDDSVKVMDFGIARAGNSTMTQTGSVLGTAHYVSPEQAQGRPLTAASDLYSLGVTLYEAATGRVPFDAETPVAIALKQVNDTPRRPRELNPGIDPRLEAVILRAMAKRPAERYETAEDMRRDLLAVASGERAASASPVVAAPPVVPMPPADGTAVMPRVAGESRPQATHSQVVRPVPKRRPTVWPWIVLAVVLIAGGLTGAWALDLLGGSSGSPIPDVVGMDLEAAEDAIRAAGFEVGKVTKEYDDKIAADKVIEQSPSADASAKEGSYIDLVVSKGVKTVEVPSVIELKEDKARKLITEAGLVPEPLPGENSATVEAGFVIRQVPEPGEEVSEGSPVQYVVSLGKSTVVVPDVRNKSRSAATEALRSVGLKVSVTEQFDEAVKTGIVISQSPLPDVEVVEGSTVTIVVSKGSAMADVPDVIGQTEAAATAALKNAGFKVSVNYEPHAENGQVISQSPKSGKAERGSTVTIVVDSSGP
ncbi:MAG: Stk1 family PASTA domain-containing Ser/Thr kinase [Coriobacteriia bacterium]|nr:Stk1 family PASTA domain-containing Ser/Thr kinase [Coriobacteriia bacterium]